MNNNQTDLLGHTFDFLGHTYKVIAITENCYLINRDGVLFMAAVRTHRDGGIDITRNEEEFDVESKRYSTRFRTILHLRSRYDNIAGSEVMVDKIIKVAAKQ